MNDNQTSGAQFERLARHLDELAAHSTRAVADLRVQSQLIVGESLDFAAHAP